MCHFCFVLERARESVHPTKSARQTYVEPPPQSVCALSDYYNVASTDLVHDILLVKKFAPVSNSGVCGWALLHVRRPIALLTENSYAHLHLWMS